ncbi:MAG TPA: lysophospholipid acyltransferase family protein [Bordetella sp.]
MLLILVRLLAALPLPVLHTLGRLAGRLVYACPSRYRRRLRANAAQAGYPDAAFARRAAGEIGAMILETPRIWFRHEASLAMVVSDDEQLVQQARAEGKGLLFLTPHLGSFEICARYITRDIPGTVMFRPPRKAILAPLFDSARNTANVHAVPATQQGVREFVRALRRGELVGMLPDQVPGPSEGVWAPFFGRMAYTITLPVKLAVQTGATIIVTTGERLPGGRGWRMHYVRVPAPLPEDATAQAALLNEAMEALIRRFPHQYLWGYNRYKTPPGAPPAPDADAFPST